MATTAMRNVIHPKHGYHCRPSAVLKEAKLYIGRWNIN